MTIFYPDISSFQAGIDLKGALAVCIKSTQGTGYTNPDYTRALANARSHGTVAFSYNFLLGSNIGVSPAAQAAHCYAVTGKTPLMLDPRPATPAGDVIASPQRLAVHADEPSATSRPSIADACAFVDAYRKAGGICWLAYLPHWYWQQIGSPSLAPLADRGLLLVSSAYTGYTDAPTGTGWLPYGGMTPTIWQYSDSVGFNGHSVDFNAYRGTHPGDESPAAVADTVAELASIVATGKLPAAHTQFHGAYYSGGQLSLADLSVKLGWAPSAILRMTAIHRGFFDPVLSAYISGLARGDVAPGDPLPAGAKLWMD